jgi:hypothetical protein
MAIRRLQILPHKSLNLSLIPAPNRPALANATKILMW